MELDGDLASEMLVIPKGTAMEGYGPISEPNGLKWTTTFSTNPVVSTSRCRFRPFSFLAPS